MVYGCTAFARQVFHSGGRGAVYRDGFCEELLEASPMLMEPVPGSSKMEPPLVKAKAISSGSSSSGVTEG